jgi:HNH endonuclease
MKHAYLLSIVRYNPRTGEFISLVKRKRINVGDVIGSISQRGYARTTIDGKHYYLHRLAWFYVHGKWPRKRLDHKNGKYADNRIRNLRQATSVQNGRNRKIGVNNTSGVVGVNYLKTKGKFRASIKVPEKRVVLGCFENFEDACAARRSAEILYFGEFRRAV